TWDQILPQNTWKIQDSQVFTKNLFASASYSGQNGQFNLTPEGGLAKQTFLDADGVWHNTYEFYSAPRPQRQVKADFSVFFNAGVRWDRQYGENLAGVVPSNPTFPTILPSVNYPGAATNFTLNNYEPRVGLTYALGANRTTLLKASYAQYAEALGTGSVGVTNPLGSASYAYYAWNDKNGN